MRMVTAIQLSTARAARQTAWRECACSAITLASTSLPAPDPAPLANLLVMDLPNRIHKVWGLRWSNGWKEIWWRLLLHGIPGAGGHSIPWARGTKCVCGWHTADAACSSVRALQQREHVFWSCPCAQIIQGILAENLPGSFTMLPSHVWMLIPPSPRINSQVWWVACLCVLTAILKLRHTDHSSLKERCTNFVFLGLQDFVACQGQQSPLLDFLSHDHPFIAKSHSGTLVVNFPRSLRA